MAVKGLIIQQCGLRLVTHLLSDAVGCEYTRAVSLHVLAQCYTYTTVGWVGV